MNEHIQSALNMLKIVRRSTDAIGMGISFGKDSMAVLDLVCHVFPRVEGYYLYRVADLETVKRWADEVKVRYGVNVRMYPHFDLSRCYKYHVFQPHWKMPKVPKINMLDIETHFRKAANVEWLDYGWRRNDSFSRALIMKKTGGLDFDARRVFPLRSWKNSQVYEYLDNAKIKRPEKLGRKEQGGLDFHRGAIEELAKTPGDLKKWLRDFPFSEIQMVQQPQTGINAPKRRRALSA